MTIFLNLDPLWATAAAIVLMVSGLLRVLRGLGGNSDGARALLRKQTDMLNRMQGFRLTVFGLVLIGIGAAVMWQARWLLLLALGIGFVEILESSTLIAVWKWGRRSMIGRKGGDKVAGWQGRGVAGKTLEPPASLDFSKVPHPSMCRSQIGSPATLIIRVTGELSPSDSHHRQHLADSRSGSRMREWARDIRG